MVDLTCVVVGRVLICTVQVEPAWLLDVPAYGAPKPPELVIVPMVVPFAPFRLAAETVTIGGVASALVTWNVMLVLAPPITETWACGVPTNCGENCAAFTVKVKLLETIVVPALSTFVAKTQIVATPLSEETALLVGVMFRIKSPALATLPE